MDAATASTGFSLAGAEITAGKSGAGDEPPSESSRSRRDEARATRFVERPLLATRFELLTATAGFLGRLDAEDAGCGVGTGSAAAAAADVQEET